MNGLHMFLGLAVVGLNGFAGVRGLVLRRSGEADAALVVWAHGALAIQVASGFFLFTGSSEGPGLWHYILPGASLAAVVAARAANGDARVLAIGAASLFAAAAATFAYLTGIAHG